MLREPNRNDPLSADWARDLVREVRRQRVTAGLGLRETQTDNGKILSLVRHDRPPASGQSPGYPFGDKYNFGISIADAVVSILKAIVKHGTLTTDLDITSAQITIEADGDWVCLEVTLGETPDEDEFAFTREATIPQSTDTKWIFPLHQFTIDPEAETPVASLKCSSIFDGIIDAIDEVIGDADQETPDFCSIETRDVEEDDSTVHVRQLFEFDAPSDYTLPYSGTKPTVLVRDVEADPPKLSYGTIPDLAKSVLEEYSAGDGIEIDVDGMEISATPYTAGDGIDITDFVVSATPYTAGNGIDITDFVVSSKVLPDGGNKYQVLAKTSDADGDVAWDWLRYVVPA